MRSTFFLPAALALVPTAITVACYGPTEVTVTVSTDLRCEQTPRTAIFKGLPFETAPDAETETCTPVPNADATIGSLVFLPSGDDNGRAAVKAVLARGRPVTECDAHPEDCIVATRSFSFVRHLSRRVPIRMLSECLGKQCPEGTTCGPGRTCIPDECKTDDCGLPIEPADDAGSRPSADAGVDATPDGEAPRCRGPNGNGVLFQSSSGIPGPLAAAFGLDTFYFALPTVASGGPQVLSLTTAGGAVTPAFAVPGPDGSLIALTTFGNNWLVAHDRSVGPTTPVALSTAKGMVELEVNSMNPVNSVVAAVEDLKQPIAYVARSINVEKVDLSSSVDPRTSVFYDKSGGVHLEVDSRFVYLSTKEGIAAIDRASGESKGLVPLVPESRNIVTFAKHNDSVYVAGRDTTNGGHAIVALDGATSVPIIGVGTPVVSMAVDQLHLYWTDGQTISRILRTSAAEKPVTVLIAQAGERFDHLALSGECIYYWTEAMGVIASTELRSFAKPLPFGQ